MILIYITHLTRNFINDLIKLDRIDEINKLRNTMNVDVKKYPKPLPCDINPDSLWEAFWSEKYEQWYFVHINTEETVWDAPDSVRCIPDSESEESEDESNSSFYEESEGESDYEEDTSENFKTPSNQNELEHEDSTSSVSVKVRSRSGE